MIASLKISIRLLLLTAVVVAIPWASITGAAIFASNHDVEIESIRKITAVAQDFSQQVMKAIKLDIPFTELRGVDEVMQNILNDNPEITIIALTDESGKVLFSLDRTKGHPPEDILLDPTRLAAANMVDVPMRDGSSEALGYVVIGRNPDTSLSIDRWDLISTGLVVIVLAMELAGFLLRTHIQAPADLLHKMIAIVSLRDFTHRAVDCPPDECGAALTALNRLISHVNFHYQEVRMHADDVESAGSDSSLTKLVEEPMVTLQQHARFAKQAPDQETPDTIMARWRFCAFLFCMADTMLFIILPFYFTDQGFSSPTTLLAYVAVAFLASVSLAGRAAGRQIMAVGLRGATVLGSIMVLAPFLLGTLIGQAGIAAFLLTAILHGAGIGVVLHACGGAWGARWREQGDSFKEGTGAMASGLSCGAMASQFLDVFFKYDTILTGATGIAACACLLALLQSRPSVKERNQLREQTWLGWGEIQAILLHRGLSNLLLAALLPLQAFFVSFFVVFLPVWSLDHQLSTAGFGRLLTGLGMFIAVGWLAGGAALSRWMRSGLMTLYLLQLIAALLFPLYTLLGVVAMTACVGLAFGALSSSRNLLLSSAAGNEISLLGKERVVMAARLTETAAMFLGIGLALFSEKLNTGLLTLSTLFLSFGICIYGIFQTRYRKEVPPKRGHSHL